MLAAQQRYAQEQEAKEAAIGAQLEDLAKRFRDMQLKSKTFKKFREEVCAGVKERTKIEQADKFKR